MERLEEAAGALGVARVVAHLGELRVAEFLDLLGGAAAAHYLCADGAEGLD